MDIIERQKEYLKFTIDHVCTNVFPYRFFEVFDHNVRTTCGKLTKVIHDFIKPNRFETDYTEKVIAKMILTEAAYRVCGAGDVLGFRASTALFLLHKNYPCFFDYTIGYLTMYEIGSNKGFEHTCLIIYDEDGSFEFIVDPYYKKVTHVKSFKDVKKYCHDLRNVFGNGDNNKELRINHNAYFNLVDLTNRKLKNEANKIITTTYEYTTTFIVKLMDELHQRH